MRQESFEQKNQPIWKTYQDIVDYLDSSDKNSVVPPDTGRFPSLYRKICNHYALSLSRQYSPALVTRLHTMVLAGHKKIYKKSSFRMSTIAEFFSYTFPNTFRENILYFALALFLFAGPLLATGIACYQKQDLIYSIMSPSQVADFEFMYDPANPKTGRTQGRSSDLKVAMFGFYIKNNISIGFQTFAGGILAGVGTLFFLIYNGVILGGVCGHVTALGFTQTFWPFVCGHGAFELTAIVISGMAGLIIAKALIAPGNLKRNDALKQRAPKALVLMLGASAMLLIAAFIEAFWSPSGLDATIKYMAAGFFWSVVIIYLGLAGKRRDLIAYRQRREIRS